MTTADLIARLRAGTITPEICEAAAVALERAQWQPFKTVPRDGTWFLACTDGWQRRFVHFADRYDRFPISHDGVVWEREPNLWLYVPIVDTLKGTTK